MSKIKEDIGKSTHISDSQKQYTFSAPLTVEDPFYEKEMFEKSFYTNEDIIPRLKLSDVPHPPRR